MCRAHSRICGGISVLHLNHHQLTPCAIQNSCKLILCNKSLLNGTTSLKPLAGSMTNADTRGNTLGETYESLLHFNGSSAAIRHARGCLLLPCRNREDQEAYATWKKTRFLLKTSDRETGKRATEVRVR